MSIQQPLTMLIPVAVQSENKALGAMQEASGAIRTGFVDSPSTHFARLVLLENPKRILFTSNFDGDRDDYIDEVIGAAGTQLDAIWRLCEGYQPGNGDLLRELLGKYSIKVDTFYVALPGATVSAIRQSAASRDQLDQVLDNAPNMSTGPSPSTAGKKVRAGPAKDSLLAKVGEWIVGIREGVQEPDAVIRTGSELYVIEDIFVQNQMTVIVPVKKSPLSKAILPIVLWATNRAARNARGSLSGITTIHFARWTIIDGGDSLLFESNYDGSWESYIDDFVDTASVGMNIIWGNCEGFPKGGSRDVEAFKAYIRRHQIPSQVFYSAYEDLTMKNILTDLAVSGLVPAFARASGKSEFAEGIYSGSYPVQ